MIFALLFLPNALYFLSLLWSVFGKKKKCKINYQMHSIIRTKNGVHLIKKGVQKLFPYNYYIYIYCDLEGRIRNPIYIWFVNCKGKANLSLRISTKKERKCSPKTQSILSEFPV